MKKRRKSNHNKDQSRYKNIDMPLCYFWRAMHGNRGDKEKNKEKNGSFEPHHSSNVTTVA